ncbi:MAG TPA: tRNA pseudouridine(38-40) synthase TruA [Bdellovibrionota bacterium]|nr:tRNA pseudouridine(38-40) synthase TruA [Bdellovibrionota bacterium]
MRRGPRPGPPPGTRRTIRIDVQYEGTAYVGWQRQLKGASIHGLLERALGKIADEKVTLFSAGRTDAGVHARQQVASFSLRTSRTPVEAFVDGTNTLLPPDIRVYRSEEAELLFHAPEAKEKTYRYFFQIGAEPLVFLRNYTWHVRQALDLEAMREATKQLVGTHDFAAFRTRGTETKTTERTVREAVWGSGPLELLYFEITADGFLKQMVRNIVGTLVEVGQGKRKPSDIPDILASKRREKSGVSAPAQGLFLWRVVY